MTESLWVNISWGVTRRDSQLPCFEMATSRYIHGRQLSRRNRELCLPLASEPQMLHSTADAISLPAGDS